MATPVDVISAIRTNTAEIGVAKQRLNEINDAVSSQLETNVEAVAKGTITGTDGRPTTPDAAKQVLSAELAEQTANQRRAQTVDFENYSNELLTAIKQQGAIALAKREEVQKINSSSNPLEHILGVFTIPFKAAEVADAEGIVQSKTQELAAVNQLMQSSARTTAEIQTRVTESTNASVSEALLHDQMGATARAKIQALQTNAHGIKEILNLNEQQLRNKIKEFDIGEAVEMRALRKAQIQSMIDARADSADAKSVREGAMDFINLALVANGKTELPDNQKALIADQLNKPGQAGELARSLFAKGLEITMAGGKVIQGSTPTEAAEFRQQIGYAPQNETEQNTLGIVQGLMTHSRLVQEAPNTKQGKQDAANLAVKQKLDTDENNISTDRNSLAKPITWATAAMSEAFLNNRLFKEVISPQITDNISTNAIEPVELFKRLTTAVKAKQGTIDEAVALYNSYATLSIQMNNDATGLTKLTGFQQTKFRVSLPLPKANTKLFNFPGTDTEVPGLKTAAKGLIGAAPSWAINVLNQHTSTPVDALSQPKLYDAFASYLSGELKEPAVTK